MAAAAKILIKVGAWFAALPYLLVVILLLTGSPTWSGIAYLGGLGLLMTGLLTLPTGEKTERRVFGRRWPRGLSRAALVVLATIAFVRGCSAGRGETLHFAEDARFVDRIVDERDLALTGMRVLVAGGLLQDDAQAMPEAMRAAYLKMHAQQGDVPSPVLATYLGLQRPDAFDTVVLEPKSNPHPRNAIIFLHGYGGSFALPCWQVAEAVSTLGVLTVCPSTNYVGMWESPAGEAIVHRTVDALRARGVNHIVIAGLSNGGYGLSELAPKMRGTFAGIVLISGADSRCGDPGVPTLVIHGRSDGMASFAEAAAYVASHPRATMLALDAGHFAMLVRSTETNRALRDFVVRVTPPDDPVTADRSL